MRKRHLTFLSLTFATLVVTGGCRREATPVPAGGAATAGASAAPALTRAPLGEFRLRVELKPNGVDLLFGERRLDPSCTRAAQSEAPTVAAPAGGGVAADGLTRCARAMKDTLAAPQETQGLLTATPDTPYRDLIAAMDALRSDGTVPLFPDLNLLPPLGAALPKPGASLPPGNVVAERGEDEDNLVLVLSKTQVLLADERVATIENGDVDPKLLDAAFAKQKKNKELFVIADQGVQYRLLFRALQASASAGVVKYQLLVLQKK